MIYTIVSRRLVIIRWPKNFMKKSLEKVVTFCEKSLEKVVFLPLKVLVENC